MILPIFSCAYKNQNSLKHPQKSLKKETKVNAERNRPE